MLPVLVAVVAPGSLAHAQYTEPSPTPTTEPVPVAEPVPTYSSDDYTSSSEPGYLESVGMSLSVGGGVTDFTGESMRDVTGTGGMWDVRVGFLTNLPVSAEIAYQGGLQDINALGLVGDARLLSTTIEGDARVNFIWGNWTWQPYAFAGLSWRRYDITNEDANLSSIEGSDDVMEIPLGVGASARFSGFLVDLRGSWRPAFYADLLPSATGGEDADMHTWQAQLRLGYSF
jgi:hypothetical protein